MSDVQTRGGSRRTFAIISHPDAGKTTLTEKFLLFGGAIHMAGQVSARGKGRRTQSDWMEIERARGISVSSSVMTFDRDGIVYNLLDTPGHQDFSEDTYRTLTAVDSAIMVIDAAKGIEAQTRKLFEVCRLRDVPILTFVNKIDREGRHPLELLDEIGSTLALDVSPISWPIGMGSLFGGTYDFRDNTATIFDRENKAQRAEKLVCDGLADPKLAAAVSEIAFREFGNDAELARGAYPTFDVESYRAGHMTPVVFGSALMDFGVAELLSCLAAWAPPPRPQPAVPAPVEPTAKSVTGFVFKVQANMDPNHRDRVAFVRICSGTFKRGMKLKQVRTGKPVPTSSPIFFFAQERALAEEALPGDIVGIPSHGALRVGDTLSEGEAIRFTGLPNFAPEILRRVRLNDPLRTKNMRKALQDLAEEGVAQIFRPTIGAEWLVGVVGALQLDVLASRLKAEYSTPVTFEPVPYEYVRWMSSDDPKALRQFADANPLSVLTDGDELPVFLARNNWELNHMTERWKTIRFSATRERS
jgi:peptide chain release factor 3